LTPEQAAAQAAYYQQVSAARPMIPPNPRWHRPDAVPKQAVVLMTVVVALFGAWAAFHAEGVGIGLALTGIAMVALPLAAGDRRDLVPRLPGAVLVAALWSVAAIRDAGWVVFLCSAAAFLLTPLVLAPQRRFSGTLLTVSMGWLEGFAETFKWARRARRRKDGRDPTTVRNLWVALVTVVLLLVFGGLFAAADRTFADLIAQMLPDLSPAEFILRLLLAAVLLPLVLVWTYTAVAKPVYDSDGGAHRTISRFELAVPLGALNLLFAAFIAVQLRVYLGGEDYVRETAGLTFAEYARRGFWQLSFVAALSLAVIAIAAWLAPKREKADRWTARILLGALCVFSMVVIASALFRMYTYVETFGLTRMRIWIFTVEIWLAVLFALVIVCCWKLRASWLPRAVLATGALALLGLAAANPDALIARYNIEHDRELELDLYYLEGLSADAVPELAGADLTDNERDCLLYEWAEQAKDREPLAWNWGFQQAADAAKGTREPTGVHCSGRSDGLGLDDPDGDRPTSSEGTIEEDESAVGFFHWDSCAMYDLAAVTTLFGTSANGDWGVEPDDPSQYGEELLPEEGRGDRVLHCGYYGPGTKYLMIETFEWPSASEAAAGLQAMRAEREADELYSVADLRSEAEAGYTTIIGDDPADVEYVEAVGEVVVVVSLSDVAAVDGPVEAGIDTVGRDLVDQSYALYLELA
jgi:hypothetical protein